MHVMLNESTVLRKSCDDCVEHPVKREVASTEENQEDISNLEKPIMNFRGKQEPSKIIQRIKSWEI